MKRLRFASMIINNFELFRLLTQREILGPYKGAALGIWWSLLLPLISLGIYTVIFSQVFQARWGGGFSHDNNLLFALNLFAGLIVFNLFADCMRQAPRLITSNPNFIKKIIFPVEILGAVCTGAATFRAITSLAILMTTQAIALRELPITYAYLPFVWLPLILLSMSLTWVLSGVGVFIRDLDQAIGITMNMLMFMSPIFYPIASLPERLQTIMALNPIAYVIEETRRCCIKGEPPDAYYLIIGIPASLIICELTYRIFYKSRLAFADEL